MSKLPSAANTKPGQDILQRYLVLVSNTSHTCGVEEFSRLLAARLKGRGQTHALGLDPRALAAELNNVDTILLNFPVVAWKKKLIEPALAALAARLKGKDVVVIQHEWSALDWKRRLVLAPVILLATRLLFSAPEIDVEFAGSRLSRLATRSRSVVPIPPNLVPPEHLTESAFSRRLRQERDKGRIILGQFGSIYPQKHVTAVLEVAADLRQRGEDVFVAFAGSFIKGQDTVEQDFWGAVSKYGLTDRVAVSGFIDTAGDLFAIFREIDVFCYLLPDGLTARRGSVLAAAASGKPVIVNGPANPGALAHHTLFKQLIEEEALELLPTDAKASIAADAVLSALSRQAKPADFPKALEELWRDVLVRLDKVA